MKNPLLVLLLIAVTFFFLFGTAFATAATADQKAELYAAERLALTQAETNFKLALQEIGDYTDSGYVIEAAAWESIQDTMWKDFMKYLQGLTDAAISNYPSVSAGQSLVDAVYVDNTGASVLTITAIKAAILQDYTVTAAKKQFDADKADELKKLDMVNLELYSKTTPETGATYYEQAEDVVNGLREQINQQSVSSETTVNGIKTIVGNIQGLINANIEAITIGTTGIASGFYKLSSSAYPAIKTMTDEENANLVTDATKAAQKALVAQNVATYLTTDPNPDKAFAEAYSTLYNRMIDDEIPCGIATVAALSGYSANAINNVKMIAELDAFAAKYKLEKDADGNLVRDAKAIDAIVKAEVAKAYNAPGIVTAYTAADLRTAKAAIDAAMVTSDELNFEKEVAKNRVEKARTDAAELYYDVEMAKVNAFYDKELAKIEKMTDVATAKAYTVPTVPTSIKDKTAVKAAYDATPLDTEYDKMYDGAGNGSLEKYVAYKNTNLTQRDAAWTDVTLLDAKLKEFYGSKGARTVAEMQALASEAMTVVDALPTVGSIATAKAEVEAAIKAIPATVTEADKAAVESAWNLAKAYADMTNATGADYTAKIAATDISNKATLTKKISDLNSAMALDLAKKSAAANKNDKAALKAVQAEIDAFNDAHDAEEVFEKQTKYTDTSVEKALEAIRAAELKAVKAAIDAIPLNVTEADADTVKAARAAYDAYVAEYKSYTAEDNTGKIVGDNAAKDVTNFRDLALAEATLADLLGDVDLLNVESLKITASSSATKGAITVKWTVKGEASGVKAFEIWKSTKKSSGFKKAFTTKDGTKRSYKNTKGLKKGTRYYYKVRAIAYDAAGKKVTSDWSNKAYRKAK